MDTLETTSPIVQKLGHVIEREVNSISEFRCVLKPYARADPDNIAPQFWPVVKRIELLGSFEQLEGINELLDSAGKGNSNRARNALAESDERSADVVWIVADIARCASNRMAADILQNNLRTVMMKCDMSDISVICSKADVVNEREVVKTLQLPPKSKRRNCVLARNAFVKRAMKTEIQRMVENMQFGDNEKNSAWLHLSR